MPSLWRLASCNMCVFKSGWFPPSVNCYKSGAYYYSYWVFSLPVSERWRVWIRPGTFGRYLPPPGPHLSKRLPDFTFTSAHTAKIRLFPIIIVFFLAEVISHFEKLQRTICWNLEWRSLPWQKCCWLQHFGWGCADEKKKKWNGDSSRVYSCL